MSGLWYGVAAYSLWGLLTLYWRLFPDVPAMQVLGHRIVWSFLVLVAIVAASWQRRRATLQSVTPGAIGLYALAAVLIGVNWFLYVYSVNNGFIVESSLGYFMTPLVNVMMGVAVFRERLRPMQWVAVAFAFAGVVVAHARVWDAPVDRAGAGRQLWQLRIGQEEGAAAVARGARSRNRRPPRACRSLSALPRLEWDRGIPAWWYDD